MTAPRLPSKATLGLIAAAFFLVLLGVYGLSMNNGFVRWDDGLLIYENGAVQAINFVTLKWIFTNYDPELYIPLTFLSYQFDYLISGMNPAFYHFHNLVLHTLNSLCVVWLVFLLARRKWVALLCGALFALHPLHTEAVVWASARKDVLSTLFFLLSMIGYIYYRSNKQRLPYWLSVGSFLLALMAKVTVITLPILLLLIDWREKRKWDRSLVLDKIPYFALSILFGIVAIIGKSGLLPQSSTYEKVIMAGKSTVFYLQKIFVPTDLSVLYPYFGEVSLSAPAMYFPFALFLLLVILVIASLRWTREVFFGFFFFLITISPTFINFAKGEMDLYFASDRYAYAGSIGIIFLASGLIWWLGTKRENKRDGMIAAGASVTICVTFIVLAFMQSMIWKDTTSLFSNVLEHYPDSYVAHNNLGNSYRRQREMSNAFDHYKTAVELKRHPYTLSNLGSMYREFGKVERAAELYDEALSMDPRNKQALLGMSIVHSKLGELDEAFDSYNRTLELYPQFVEAYVNRGSLHSQLDEHEEALADYDAAIAINPYFPQAHFNRAVALSKLRRMRESFDAYKKTVELAPSFVAARINLGIMYYERGKREEAINEFKAVLVYDPDNERALAAIQQMEAE